MKDWKIWLRAFAALFAVTCALVSGFMWPALLWRHEISLVAYSWLPRLLGTFFCGGLVGGVFVASVFDWLAGKPVPGAFSPRKDLN